MAGERESRRHEALATFAESLSQALARLAIDLRSTQASEQADEAGRRLTPRQADALAAVTAAGADGIASAELVAAIGGTQANTTKLLDKLVTKGHVKRVTGARPARWNTITK